MKFEYKEFNANPKNKKAGDCVIRAISIGLNKDYIEIYKELFETSLKTGYMVNDKKNFEKYLEKQKILKMKMPKRIDNTRYTVKEFVEEIAKPNKTYIINIANHLTVVKNGVLYDIWNCGRKSVGNYWVV